MTVLNNLRYPSSFFALFFLSISCFANADLNQSQQVRQQTQYAIMQKQQEMVENDNLLETPLSQSSSPIDLETAIFMAINQRDWNSLSLIINHSQQIRPDMIFFAQSALLAGQGHIKQAILSYEKLLQNYPDFLRARLDLARLYFQDGLLNESKEQFSLIKLNPYLPLTVVKKIDMYLMAIDKKQAINSTLSVGLGYERNLNESSESSSCLLSLPNSDCAFHRSTPKAIHSSALNYEITLNKDWQIWQHHGLTTNFLVYGNTYFQQHANEFNQTTTNLSLGYHHTNYNHRMIIAPMMEYRHQNHQKQYTATGARVNIHKNLKNLSSLLNKPAQLLMDIEYKNYQYVQEYNLNNGSQLSIVNTLVMKTSPHSQWFVGADYLDRNNVIQSNAYKQKGLSVGYYHDWKNGLTSTFLMRQRWKKYDAYNAILKAHRKDKQTYFYVGITLPKYAWQGFEPSISYQYHINNSNIDWLYDYDTANFWIKFRKIF